MQKSNQKMLEPFYPNHITDVSKFTQEKIIKVKKGGWMVFFIMFSLLFGIFCLSGLTIMISQIFYVFIILGLILVTGGIVCLFGLFINNPNEAQVLTLCGNYIGTVKDNGFYWVNPLSAKKTVSLRSKNLNGEVIKVNDKIGNPIMIGCVVVWRVKETARASFDVENYDNFVTVQSESAVRHIACQYPYDKQKEDDICLRSGHEEITKVLHQELSDRLAMAGIEVEEARISELAYSPEIANAMLKRQAAEAIIAAREKIVQGAVSIVGHALDSLAQNKICELPSAERARLVSNMLVVLCSESQVSPVVNTGS